MRHFCVCIGIGIILMCFVEMAFSSQKDRDQPWEMGPEKFLQIYHLAEEQTALLFSRFMTKTFTRDGIQGVIKFRRFYVDIEDIATGERRRIWQFDFNNSPQAIPRSFVFGPAESSGQFCIGMASDFRVYYALLSARKGEPSEPLSHTLNYMSIHDLSIYDALDILRAIRPGIAIDHIAYTGQEWILRIHIRVMSDTMIPLKLSGVPTEDGIQWRSRLF